MIYLKPNHLIMAALTLSLTLAGCARPSHGPASSTQRLATDVQEKTWDGGGRVLLTDHYRIFTTVQSGQLIDILPGFMEASYRNYTQITALGEAPTEGMSVYMMADRDQWADLTKHVVGPYAPLYLQIQAGGYCYRGVCVFWQMGGIGTLSVAAHEGLHQMLHYRLKNRLPMWLEEGMCTIAEGHEICGDNVIFTPQRNLSRYNDLRESIVQRSRTIPLERLLVMDAGDAVTQKTSEAAVGYYGQLWALCMYIRSEPKYRAGMERMIADAQAGRLHLALQMSPEELEQLQRQGRVYNRRVSRQLFERYISSDVSGFDRDFRKYARKIAELE